MSASSDQNIVGKDTQVAAKVEIDMGIEDWGKLAEEFLQKGDPTLVIATQLVPETGTGTSPTLIDQIVKPAGGAKTDENHMTWSNISWDTIAPYALGKQKITYMDSGITITEKTKNLYAVSMVFIFPDGTEEWFYAAGKITYTDNPKVGADRVNWGFENEDVHYYSSIGKSDILDNYVEIKEGTPGNESYEAMAGVPTTEKRKISNNYNQADINLLFFLLPLILQIEGCFFVSILLNVRNGSFELNMLDFVICFLSSFSIFSISNESHPLIVPYSIIKPALLIHFNFEQFSKANLPISTFALFNLISLSPLQSLKAA